MLLSLSSKQEESQELWRKQFRLRLIEADCKKMIEFSSRKLPPAIRKISLNQRIRDAELAVAECDVECKHAIQKQLSNYDWDEDEYEDHNCEECTKCKWIRAYVHREIGLPKISINLELIKKEQC